MYKIIICLWLSYGLSAFGTAMAQTKMKENRFEGYVITAEGAKNNVVIEVEDVKYPWAFNHDVRYFDRSLLKSGARIKREDKKPCVPGEVVEFGFGTRKFVYINHYVMDKGDKNIAVTALNKFKGDKNTDFFGEVVKDGKIQVVTFFNKPDIGDDDFENPEKMESYMAESKQTSDILMSKNGSKAKSVNDLNFDEFFVDCPEVVKKYSSGQYELKPPKSIKSRVQKKVVLGESLQKAVNEILDDYEKMCKK